MARQGLTALQRKAGADRPPPDHGVMSPSKALRLALSQAGDDLLAAAILTGTVEEARCTVPQMAEFVDEGSLVVLMQSKDGARGLAMLDAGALAAALEALTTGRISPGTPSSPPRIPTGTDAFLTRRFVTSVAGGFAGFLQGLPDAAWARPFSAGDQVRDVRNLPLLLEDRAYRMISAPLDFDRGAREGRIRLILPWDESQAAPRMLPPPQAATGLSASNEADAPGGQDTGARAALLEGELSLDAVLHRQRLPLATLLNWQPGDTVSFPASAIAAVALVDVCGTRVATARLGQAAGQRALKITGDTPADTGGSSKSDDGFLGGAASPAAPPAPMPAPTPEVAPAPMPEPEPLGGLAPLPGLPPLPGAEG